MDNEIVLLMLAELLIVVFVYYLAKQVNKKLDEREEQRYFSKRVAELKKEAEWRNAVRTAHKAQRIW